MKLINRGAAGIAILAAAAFLAAPAWAQDAVAAAAAAPPAAGADKGDTAWMLTSSALVPMMSIRTWRCSTAAWYAPRTCCRC